MSREYPGSPIVAVGAAVVRGGEVLVVRRGREPSYGVWTVPGGVVGLGETMGAAAGREVREECGIEIEVGEVVGTVDNIVRDADGRVRYHYAIVDLSARYISGDLAPNEELLDAAWIRPDQFDQYAVPRKARAILLEALRRESATPPPGVP